MDRNRDQFKGLRMVLATLPWLLVTLPGFASVTDDLRYETSSFMKSTAYRRPDRVAQSAPDGAISNVNIKWDQDHAGNWYIEEQRYAADAICAGIAQQDTAAIERGVKGLRWGFDQQQPDGSFNCPDAFHSTSFFVEAAARACLLLSASQYGNQFTSDIEWIKPRILKAAHWMTEAKVEEQGKKRNIPFTHRRYLVAAALGEAGVAGDDKSLIDHSKEYIRDGIALQQPDGVNPEKGGPDCTYQGAGLYYAACYYNLVADDEMKSALRPMLEKGYAWLKNQVLPDGTIDVSGNTRVGAAPEQGRNGTSKKVNYGIVYRGFYQWSMISNDPQYAELAEKVSKGEEIYKRQFKRS
ncbi:MAG: hypothetical protein WAK31_24995 [Chthoniobacterales bacterium]